MEETSTLVKDEIQKGLASRRNPRRYLGEVGSCQEIVNSTVARLMGVGKYDVVIDMCSGPSGSRPHISARWIGGDRALQLVRHLRENYPGSRAIVHDARRVPLPKERVDFALVVSGLNNIMGTEETISEASRILKPDGKLVVAEPCVPRKTAKFVIELLMQKMDEGSLEYEYATTFIEGCLGATASELTGDPEIREILEGKKVRSRDIFKIQEILTRRFFERVEEHAVQSGLELSGVHLLILAKNDDFNSWEEAEPIKLNKETWLKEVLKARRGKGVAADVPKEIGKSSFRLFIPILSYKKV